jgi:hypothetical protein
MNLRVTKYDPSFRNPNGQYTKVEWTSYTDIGKTFPNGILDENEYLRTEKIYLEAIKIYAEENRLSSFKLNSIEPNTFKSIENITISEKINYSIDETSILAKNILRETFWAKLKSGSDFEIHFGYDFYMYFVARTDQTNLMNRINATGLFCEIFDTPY